MLAPKANPEEGTSAATDWRQACLPCRGTSSDRDIRANADSDHSAVPGSLHICPWRRDVPMPGRRLPVYSGSAWASCRRDVTSSFRKTLRR
jgi:hypothetical protein